MFYTTEEAAIVCGFLDLYLNRDSVDCAVREQNRKFQRGAARGDLRREDYRWAEKVLDFLQPCWWQSHEDHMAAVVSAFFKEQNPPIHPAGRRVFDPFT